MTPIQFGHIEIAGVKYPVKFGTAQSRDYCNAMGCDLKDYTELFQADKDGKNKFAKLETNGEEMMALVWSALKQGARVEKQPFDLTLDDAADLIDHMNLKPKLWEDFFGVMQDGADLEEQASPNGKAKLKAA